uniref:helix-turn-helix transcriptional regulator n=1 Tax=Prevotella sp. TaxID=59823 RepID=UPI0040272956
MSDLNRLKVVLVEQKKTGKWLADQLGKSTCTVSKWCSNTVQPDIATLENIAQLLGVDKRDLLTPSNIMTNV